MEMIQKILETETLTEFTVIGDDCSIKAHRLVLATGSPVLTTLFGLDPAKYC